MLHCLPTDAAKDCNQQVSWKAGKASVQTLSCLVSMEEQQSSMSLEKSLFWTEKKATTTLFLLEGEPNQL